MRRTIFALVIACGTLVVPSALAGKPNRERLPLGGTNAYPAGVVCPTAIAPGGVQFEVIGGNWTVKLFDDGKFLATGRRILKITNIAFPDRSVVVDWDGSFASVPLADGTFADRGSGTVGFAFFPGDAGPGDTTTGRIYLFTGKLSLTENSSGAIVAYGSKGSMEDVCAEIAS
jgi:hypothetical protein